MTYSQHKSGLWTNRGSVCAISWTLENPTASWRRRARPGQSARLPWRPTALIVFLCTLYGLLWSADAAPPLTCVESVPTIPGAPLQERSCACPWVDPGASGSTPRVYPLLDSYTDPVTNESVRVGVFVKVGTPFVFNRTLSIKLGLQTTPNAPPSSTFCNARVRAINTTGCSSSPATSAVIDTLYGAWREIAGCGWTVSSNTPPGFDTYNNTVRVNWTDYFEGVPKPSSISYPVAVRLPREINVTTNSSLASDSGIRNLKATGFAIAFLQPGSNQMSVSLDYQVYSNWPHSLSFASVTPPNGTEIAALGPETVLDPSSTPATCFPSVPAGNTSSLPVNTTATQCWQSGRATFILPEDACALPGNVYDVGGLYLWQFGAGCYPPTLGNQDQGFAVSDCRSTLVQAQTTILTASTASEPVLDVCTFASLFSASSTLTVDLKNAGDSTALPGEEGDTYKFGDPIQFVANISSSTVQVSEVKLVELTVVKLGSVDKPTLPSTVGYNETLGSGLEGFGTPGFLKKLGQSTGLLVANFDPTTLRVSCVPNMGPTLDGYFLTPADDGQMLRFSFYAKFAVAYEAAGSNRRRWITHEIELGGSTRRSIWKRADVEVSMPPSKVSAQPEAKFDIRFAVGDVGGGGGGTGGETTDEGSPPPQGLSTGAIIGIAVGATVGAVLLIAGIFALTRKSKDGKKRPEGDEGFLWQEDADEKPPAPSNILGLGSATIANMVLPSDLPAEEKVANNLPVGALDGLGAATIANLVGPKHAGPRQPEVAAVEMPTHGLPSGVLDGLGAATLAGLLQPGEMASVEQPNSNLPAGALDGLGAATLAGLLQPYEKQSSDKVARERQPTPPNLPEGALGRLGAATLANLVMPSGSYAHAPAPAETQHSNPDLPVGALAGLGEATLAGMIQLQDSFNDSVDFNDIDEFIHDARSPAGDIRPSPVSPGDSPVVAGNLPEGLLAGLGAQTLANMKTPGLVSAEEAMRVALPKTVVRKTTESPTTPPSSVQLPARSPLATPPLLSPTLMAPSPYLAPTPLQGSSPALGASPALAPTRNMLTSSGPSTLSPYLTPSPILKASPSPSPTQRGLQTPTIPPASPMMFPSLASSAPNQPTPPSPVESEISADVLGMLGAQTLAGMIGPGGPYAKQSSAPPASPMIAPSKASPPLAPIPSRQKTPPSPTDIPPEVLGMLGDKTLAGLIGPDGLAAMKAASSNAASPPPASGTLSPAEKLEQSIAELQNALRQEGTN